MKVYPGRWKTRNGQIVAIRHLDPYSSRDVEKGYYFFRDVSRKGIYTGYYTADGKYGAGENEKDIIAPENEKDIIAPAEWDGQVGIGEWKARDGGKITINARQDNGQWPWCGCVHSTNYYGGSWTNEGRYSCIPAEEVPNDIVGYWTDEEPITDDMIEF